MYAQSIEDLEGILFLVCVCVCMFVQQLLKVGNNFRLLHLELCFFICISCKKSFSNL